MGDPHRKRRRVFIEDAHDNGSYLRTTWHPERRTFVVSTWVGEVCTGAVRLPAREAPELVSLLVDGLAELAAPQPQPQEAPAPGRPRPSPGRATWPAVRRWLRARTRASTPALPVGALLRSVPGRRRSA